MPFSRGRLGLLPFLRRPFLSLSADILLNVFLAIAVDNLADAESLTAIEKQEAEAEAEAEADLEKSNASESGTKEGDDRSQEELDEEEENAGEDSKGGDEEDNATEADDGEGSDRKRSKKKRVLNKLMRFTKEKVQGNLHVTHLLCTENRTTAPP